MNIFLSTHPHNLIIRFSISRHPLSAMTNKAFFSKVNSIQNLSSSHPANHKIEIIISIILISTNLITNIMQWSTIHLNLYLLSIIQNLSQHSRNNSNGYTSSNIKLKVNEICSGKCAILPKLLEVNILSTSWISRKKSWTTSVMCCIIVYWRIMR